MSEGCEVILLRRELLKVQSELYTQSLPWDILNRERRRLKGEINSAKQDLKYADGRTKRLDKSLVEADQLL